MVSGLMNQLDRILETKREEVRALRPRADKLKAAALLRDDFRSLERALTADEGRLGLIAEVKKASPSAGVIAPDFDPVRIARAYADAGASAISVLTDEVYFQGRLDYLTRIRQAVTVPVLRKDFIIDDSQIYEAVVAGADAILLIVAALEQNQLKHLLATAAGVQLEVLVEVHDLAELDRALATDARLIGINNRNLKSFKVDLATTEVLSEQVPEDLVVVSESGIRDGADAARLAATGAQALLVGETLMRCDDIHTTVAELMAPIPADDDGENDDSGHGRRPSLATGSGPVPG